MVDVGGRLVHVWRGETLAVGANANQSLGMVFNCGLPACQISAEGEDFVEDDPEYVKLSCSHSRLGSTVVRSSMIPGHLSPQRHC